MPVSTTSSRRSPKTARGVADRDVGAGTQAADLGLVATGATRPPSRRRRWRPPGATSAVDGVEPFAAARLAHVQAGGAVEPGGERGREARGHVLDDHRAAPERRRKGGDQLASAFGPPVEQAITTARAAPALRSGTRAGAGRARRGRGGHERRHAGGTTAPRRHILSSSSRKKPEASALPEGLATSSTAPSASASTARAPCAGEKAETTTTGIGRADAAQLAQHADAVQAGHREVEREHVGAVLGAQRERLVAVAAHTDDLRAALGERVRDQPAHERRVVGDDDADGL